MALKQFRADLFQLHASNPARARCLHIIREFISQVLYQTKRLLAMAAIYWGGQSTLISLFPGLPSNLKQEVDHSNLGAGTSNLGGVEAWAV